MTIEIVKELCYILTYELGVKVDYIMYSNDRARFTIDGFETNNYASISDDVKLDILGDGWDDILLSLLNAFRYDKMKINRRRVIL